MPSFPVMQFIENLNINKFNSYNQKNFVNIIHDTYYTPGIIKKSEVKKVITVHDLIHEKFKNFYRNSNDLINLKKESFKDCDHFICVSNNTKKDLMQFYSIKSENITVINHGADHLDLNSETNLKINYPFLLYVGNRERYKNFDFFLRAFANSKKVNKELKLVCFGGGKFNIREKINFRSFDTKKIVQIDGVDNLLGSYYSNASALICTFNL